MYSFVQEKPLDDELASFYSDIAKMEPIETVNDENSSDKTPTENEPSVSPDSHEAHDCGGDGDGGGGGGGETDDKKKKKKKKTKKLEPWRSGNLETWINKWQKAQKELDVQDLYFFHSDDAQPEQCETKEEKKKQFK